MKITLDITPEELANLNRLLDKDKDIIFKSKNTPTNNKLDNYTEVGGITRDLLDRITDSELNAKRKS